MSKKFADDLIKSLDTIPIKRPRGVDAIVIEAKIAEISDNLGVPVHVGWRMNQWGCMVIDDEGSVAGSGVGATIDEALDRLYVSLGMEIMVDNREEGA